MYQHKANMIRKYSRPSSSSNAKTHFARDIRPRPAHLISSLISHLSSSFPVSSNLLPYIPSKRPWRYSIVHQLLPSVVGSSDPEIEHHFVMTEIGSIATWLRPRARRSKTSHSPRVRPSSATQVASKAVSRASSDSVPVRQPRYAQYLTCSPQSGKSSDTG